MDTEDQVYRDLQRFLDTTPGGFPETESGSDIRLLKHFFTPVEARVATCLTMEPAPIRVIHDRAKKSGIDISIEELKQVLDSMLRKGTLMPRYEGYDETYYCCTDTTAGGMISVQLNEKLTKDYFDRLMEYRGEAFGPPKPGPIKLNPLRTIPVAESVPHPEKFPVSSYDSVKKLVEDAPGPFAVANCVCRQKIELLGGKCQATELIESCLMIGADHARHYVDMGIGRFVTREEVFDIIAKAQKDGLVLQPENSKKPEAICMCCGDCCVFLKPVKELPRPVDMFLTNHYVEVNPELCTGCETCVEKCQMEARTVVDGVATVNLNNCIGCGNCVALCPSDANQLRKKEDEHVPPEDKETYYMSLLSARLGK